MKHLEKMSFYFEIHIYQGLIEQGMLMKQKKLVINSVALLTLLMLIAASQSLSVVTSEHTIQLTSGEEYLYVQEKIYIDNSEINTTSSLSMWIPTDALDIKASINNTLAPVSVVQNNLYQANVSSIDQTWFITYPVELTYTLPMTLNQFSKTIIRNTSQLTITYDGDEITSVTQLKKDTTITTTFPVSADTALFNVYTLTLTILLIILLLVSFVYGLRKKKNGQMRKRAFESKDVLSTEKTLLMDILKQIEKLHRTKKMSDDTYHKLKEYYKQETIEIMRQLENLNSEIKE